MKSIHYLTLLTSLAFHTGVMAQTVSSQRTDSQVKSTQNIVSPTVSTVYNPYAPPKPDELRSNQDIQRTLSILKPNALKNRHIGDIISRFEDAGLRVAALKMIQLTPEQAAKFYEMHRERPFYADLVKFMSSGPIVVMVLEGNQAVSKNRELLGETDPKKAQKGTIRADYANSITENAAHGSDSPEAAQKEIEFFFKPNEIYAGY